MNLPDIILYEIFSYLSVLQRWECSRVCRTWRRISEDPYLYRHIRLVNLEYRSLILAIHRIVTIAPRIQTLVIDGCYSQFVQETVVSLPFYGDASTEPATSLFSHITILQPTGRRKIYKRHHFELHDQFSDVFGKLLQLNTLTIREVTISNCRLDLEMTEFFCILVNHGHKLFKFVYKDNHDDGVRSPELLQAIVIACPEMRHFDGLHAGMTDAVLYTMARHWPNLQSLSLSNRILAHNQVFSGNRRFTRAMVTDNMSDQALWNLITRCSELRSLDLRDVECDMSEFVSLCSGEPISKVHAARFKPYTIPASIHSDRTNFKTAGIPGASLNHIRISKYITSPFSISSFQRMIRLFPNLVRVEYETNFYLYAYAMDGFDQAMYEAEQQAVAKWFKESTLIDYRGKWSQSMTTEQRLVAGVTGISNRLI